MTSASRRAVVLSIVACAAMPACAVEPVPARELARVPLASPPPETSLLALTVDSVLNPAGRPVVLRLMLQPPNDADSAFIDLGQVALHPNDQPATFLIRVPAAWINEARLRTTASVLVINIVRPPGESAVDVQVNVRAVWMREPR